MITKIIKIKKMKTFQNNYKKKNNKLMINFQKLKNQKNKLCKNNNIIIL